MAKQGTASNILTYSTRCVLDICNTSYVFFCRIRSSDGPSASPRCGSVLDKFLESKDAAKGREFEHELIVSREGKQQSQERLPDERSLLQR